VTGEKLLAYVTDMVHKDYPRIKWWPNERGRPTWTTVYTYTVSLRYLYLEQCVKSGRVPDESSLMTDEIMARLVEYRQW